MVIKFVEYLLYGHEEKETFQSFDVSTPTPYRSIIGVHMNIM